MKLFFIISVWMCLLLVLVRSIYLGRIRSQRAQQLWQIFILCGVAFTFWGENSEQMLDQYFGGQPVAVLVKYTCLIWVAHLFYQMLNAFRPDHVSRKLAWLAPVALSYIPPNSFAV